MILLIDIDEKEYKETKEFMDDGYLTPIEIAVSKGIPLEDIKTEIEQTVIKEQIEDFNWALGLRYSLKIIDKCTRKENKQ